MRLLAVLLFTTLLARSASAAATATPLLRDPGFAGWTFVSPGNATLADVVSLGADGVLTLTGQPLGYLQSTATYTNFHLHAEWRWTAKPGNSGILVHIATGPVDRHLWPRCLQIQTKHTHVGDLIPMAGATFAEALSTPPAAPTPQLFHTAAGSENPAGAWNACDILCRDGTIEVTVNGVVQNRVTHCDPAAGHLGFQFEGTPYALRHVTVEPLSATAP